MNHNCDFPWEEADAWMDFRDWCETTLAGINGYMQRASCASSNDDSEDNDEGGEDDFVIVDNHPSDKNVIMASRWP